jgi:tetratricopeptide (TPR) repeat protein
MKAGKDPAKAFALACLSRSDVETSAYVQQVARKLESDAVTVRDFLKNLTIEYGVPDRSTIRPFYVVNLAEKYLSEGSISGVTAADAWDAVVNLVAQISRDFDLREFSALDFTDPRSLSLENLNFSKIERRTIRREKVLDAIRGRLAPMENLYLKATNLWIREPVDGFVGRSAEMLEMQEQLNFPDRDPVIALLGMSGVGKSELLTQYAWAHSEEYSFVWWTRGDSWEMMLKDLSALTDKLGLPRPTTPESKHAVKEYFRSTPGLLLIDNAPLDEDIQSIIPSGAKTHILISSLDQRWAAQVRSIQVTPLVEQEALGLFESLLPTLAPRELENLISVLGGLPLAIRQAAGYIAVSGINPKTYTELLRTRANDLLNRSAPREHVGLAAAWEITSAYLAETHVPAYRLLQVLSLLAASSFPVELFHVLLTIRDQDIQKDEVDDRVDIAAAAELSHFGAESFEWLEKFTDALFLHDCIADLQKFSLIDVQPHGISSHSLTQQLARQSMSSSIEYSCLECVVFLLHKVAALDPQDSRYWPHYRSMMPHFEAVLERMRGKSGLTQNLLLFCCVIGLNMNAMGMHELAIRYGQEAVSVAGASAAKFPLELFSVTMLVESLTALGRFDQAMRMAREYIGKCDERVAYTLNACELRNKIASIYYWKGDLDKAAAELDATEDLISASDSTAAKRAIVASRANLRREMGDAAGVIPDLQRLIDTYPDSSPRNELATLYCNLSLAYLDVGNPKAALSASLDAVKIDMEHSGELHGNSARDWNNAGLAWLELGKPNDASRAFKESLRIHDEIGDFNSLRRLVVQVNLGRAYLAQGDLETSRKTMEDALVKQELIFGANHRDVATTLTNLAVVYGDLRMMGKSAQLARRAIKIDLAVYGEGHPELITDYANLAGPLIALEQYTAAEKWLGKAYGIAVKYYGSDHFKAAYCKCQIAICRYRQGDWVGGVSTMEECLRVFVESFGLDHPQVTRCEEMLAAMRTHSV